MGLFDFSMMKRSVRSLGERLAALRTQIAELQRKRESVLYAAASKADVKALVDRWVTESAARYTANLRTTLNRFVRDPQSTASERLAQPVNVVGASHPFDNDVDARDMNEALCGLFGEQMRAALAKAINAMEWPEEGLPLEERPAEVERLGGQIQALQKEEAELVAQAQEIGLAL